MLTLLSLDDAATVVGCLITTSSAWLGPDKTPIPPLCSGKIESSIISDTRLNVPFSMPLATWIKVFLDVSNWSISFDTSLIAFVGRAIR